MIVVHTCALMCVVSLFVLFGFFSYCVCFFFFFQAEDGIRYLVRSRGLGDVYKRQGAASRFILTTTKIGLSQVKTAPPTNLLGTETRVRLSLIHI